MMDLQYGAYYEPPPGDDVDFLFDVVDATSGANFMDLPAVQMTGYGTVPDRAMGNAVLKMPFITGGLNGAREANGEPVLPKLTVEVLAAVNNPIQLPKLSLSGITGISGGMGIPALQVAVKATFSYRVGRVNIPDFIIEAEATNPWVARGGMQLPWLRYTGDAGESAAWMLPRLSIAGTAISQAPATGRFIFPTLALGGSADMEYLGNGEYVLPTCRISGIAVIGPVGIGQYISPAIRIGGVAQFSPVGDRTGEFLLPAVGVKGFVINSKAPYIIRHRRYRCVPTSGDYSLPAVGIDGAVNN